MSRSSSPSSRILSWWPVRCSPWTSRCLPPPRSEEHTSELHAALPILLDTRVTPELEGEGIARDVVRVIQAARRAAGLDVSDRIRLTVEGDEQVVLAVQSHSELVAGEVLAVDVAVPAAPKIGRAHV